MKSKTISNGILRAFFIITGIVLVLYLLYKIYPVFVYIALASVISLIGRPIVIFLKRRLKFSNTLAVVSTMLLLLLFIVGFVSLFIPLIIEQGENLSLHKMDVLKQNFESVYEDTKNYFLANNIDIEKQLESYSFTDAINLNFIPDFLNGFISFLGSLTIGLFSTLFISFFFLKDSKMFERSIMATAPRGREISFRRSLEKIKDLLSRYFIGLGFQISILFVIYTITLLIFGIENAVVIAFLCALLNLIPYLGPLISFFLIILLTMSSNIDADFSTVTLPTTIYVIIGFLIGQLIDNFFSQPYIFSNSVKSHPLEIFLIILIAGILFGPVGMIVCIPAYTAIKVILKEFLPENKLVKSITKNL